MTDRPKSDLEVKIVEACRIVLEAMQTAQATAKTSKVNPLSPIGLQCTSVLSALNRASKGLEKAYDAAIILDRLIAQTTDPALCAVKPPCSTAQNHDAGNPAKE